MVRPALQGSHIKSIAMLLQVADLKASQVQLEAALLRTVSAYQDMLTKVQGERTHWQACPLARR